MLQYRRYVPAELERLVNHFSYITTQPIRRKWRWYRPTNRTFQTTRRSRGVAMIHSTVDFLLPRPLLILSIKSNERFFVEQRRFWLWKAMSRQLLFFKNSNVSLNSSMWTNRCCCHNLVLSHLVLIPKKLFHPLYGISLLAIDKVVVFGLIGSAFGNTSFDLLLVLSPQTP